MRASIRARCWSTTPSCIMLRPRNDVPHTPAWAVNPWIREPVITFWSLEDDRGAAELRRAPQPQAPGAARRIEAVGKLTGAPECRSCHFRSRLRLRGPWTRRAGATSGWAAASLIVVPKARCRTHRARPRTLEAVMFKQFALFGNAYFARPLPPGTWPKASDDQTSSPEGVVLCVRRLDP
jgi:hypothetical protein